MRTQIHRTPNTVSSNTVSSSHREITLYPTQRSGDTIVPHAKMRRSSCTPHSAAPFVREHSAPRNTACGPRRRLENSTFLPRRSRGSACGFGWRTCDLMPCVSLAQPQYRLDNSAFRGRRRRGSACGSDWSTCDLMRITMDGSPYQYTGLSWPV